MEPLIARLRARYQTCRSYYDVGRATHASETVEFRTWFQRPQLFRFSWQIMGEGRPDAAFDLTADGTQVIFTQRGSSERRDSLLSGLVAANSATFGAARKIANLLLPEANQSGLDLLSLRAYEPLQDDFMADVRCARLRALLNASNFADLWIDSESLSIRKIRLDCAGKMPPPETMAAIEQYSPTTAKEIVKALADDPDSERRITEFVYTQVAFDQHLAVRTFGRS